MSSEERVETASSPEGASVESAGVVREMDWMECDACGEALQLMGHCKYLCRRCGFLRTCMDTV